MLDKITFHLASSLLPLCSLIVYLFRTARETCKILNHRIVALLKIFQVIPITCIVKSKSSSEFMRLYLIWTPSMLKMYYFLLAHSTLTDGFLQVPLKGKCHPSLEPSYFFFLPPDFKFPHGSYSLFTALVSPLECKASKSSLTTLHKTVSSFTFNTSFLFCFVFFITCITYGNLILYTHTLYWFIDSFFQNIIPTNQGPCSTHCSIVNAYNSSCT